MKNVTYEQVLDIIKQLPISQVKTLIIDVKSILEKEKCKKDVSSFQKMLLSTPTMSDKQYEDFSESRKILNQWRVK